MIVGLGSDLVDVSQVRKELARCAWRADEGVFTSGEIAWCNSSRQPERRFAVCFAAKEATLKALGVEVGSLGMFRGIEVKIGKRTGGEIVLHGALQAVANELCVRHINLSVAVAAKNVAAMVILES